MRRYLHPYTDSETALKGAPEPNFKHGPTYQTLAAYVVATAAARNADLAGQTRVKDGNQPPGKLVIKLFRSQKDGRAAPGHR